MSYRFMQPKPGVLLPSVSWFRSEHSGMVNILGMVPTNLSPDQAIELGHMLVDAGLDARRAPE